MRKTLRQKMMEAKAEKKPTTINSIEDFYKLLCDGERDEADRELNPTQITFWNDPSFLRSYGGPAGCAKTSTGVADIIMRALTEPGSKHLIARLDYNDLKDTTRLRFDEMISRLPPGTVVDKSEQAPAKIWLRPMTVNGVDPEKLSVITFMGLKGGLGSYEFTSAFVDEADECEKKMIDEIITRLRNKEGSRGLSVAFNPPDINHWLYTACTGLNAQGEQVEGGKIFSHHRPNPRENQRNLPPNYYDLMAGMAEEMRMRLRDGEWGIVFPGEPVIREFRRTVHCRSLSFEKGTLYRFWDFGYNRPCCLWAQANKDGRVRVLHEFLGHYLEGEQFINQVKLMTTTLFPSATNIVDFGDPAVTQHKDTGSMLALLAKAGIHIGFSKCEIDVSLRVVRNKCNTLISGEPAILVDARKCPILVGALLGGYHFKKDGVTPHKDGYYDHPMDCLRYGIWNLFGVGETTTSSASQQSVAQWNYVRS